MIDEKKTEHTTKAVETQPIKQRLTRVQQAGVWTDPRLGPGWILMLPWQLLHMVLCFSQHGSDFRLK